MCVCVCVTEKERERERERETIRLYRVSQELRPLLRGLIPELILSQKRHTHMGPIRNGSGVMSFLSIINKLEWKEEY